MHSIIYEHILDAADLGYFEVDVTSLIVKRNYKYDQILGNSNSVSEWTYENFLVCVFIEDVEIVKKNFDALFSDGTEHKLEFRIVRNDGEIRWISSIGVQLKNNEGKITSVLGLIKDITEDHIVRSRLEKTEIVFKQFAENLKLAFYKMSQDCAKIKFLNQEIEVITGKPRQSISEVMQWLDLVVIEDRSKVKEFYLNQANSKVYNAEIEYKIKGRDGMIRNILDKCFVTNDPSKKVVGILGIVADLTDVIAKRRLADIFDEIKDVIVKDSPLQEVLNKALKIICQRMQWQIGEIWVLDETKKLLYRTGKYIDYNERHRSENLEAIDTLHVNTRIISGLLEISEPTYIRDDKQLWNQNYPLCVAAKLTHNEEKLGIINFFINKNDDLPQDVMYMLQCAANLISDYLQQQFIKDQYYFVSNYDVVTGLPNRQAMIKSLRDLISNKSITSIVIIKVLIDQIEKINQALGSEVGNILLKELTSHYIQSPHINLQIISNIDDKGFVFVYSDLKTFAELDSICKQILKINEMIFNILDNEIFVTASIGVSIFPQDGANEAALLAGAKAAVNKSHNSGGNCITYASNTLNDELFQQINIEFALHRALEKNEFVLHYQPKVDLTTGVVVGAEALIRWQDPDGTLHMPSYFLDIAEDTDLIIPIGEWVLREVCRQISENDLGVSIAINLSIRQFKTSNYFFELVKNTINEFDINPKRLELEVTESILISGNEIINDLKKLRHLGIKIAFDDFGTKYCSLSYLKNFTPDRMKIDKSFVDGVPSSPTNIAIINAIVALAKSLNILLTVEGAEASEQVRFFINLGCDEIQSFYISKAVPVAEFKKLLKNNYKSLLQSAAV